MDIKKATLGTLIAILVSGCTTHVKNEVNAVNCAPDNVARPIGCIVPKPPVVTNTDKKTQESETKVQPLMRISENGPGDTKGTEVIYSDRPDYEYIGYRAPESAIAPLKGADKPIPAAKPDALDVKGTNTNTRYTIQIAAYKEPSNLKDALQSTADLSGRYVYQQNGLGRLSIGKYSSVQQARLAAEQLKNQGYSVYVRQLPANAITATEAIAAF